MRIGIIGGTGLEARLLGGVDPHDVEPIDRETPFGKPSAPIVTGTVSGEGVNIAGSHTDVHPDGRVAVTMTLQVASMEQLSRLFSRVEGVRGVRGVARSEEAGQREQPITPELANMLLKEQEMADDPNGWIFPSPKPQASLSGHRYRMGKPFRRSVIRAGLDGEGVLVQLQLRHDVFDILARVLNKGLRIAGEIDILLGKDFLRPLALRDLDQQAPVTDIDDQGIVWLRPIQRPLVEKRIGRR